MWFRLPLALAGAAVALYHTLDAVLARDAADVAAVGVQRTPTAATGDR